MIHSNRIRIIKEALDEYTHQMPLHRYLKLFTARNKQMGSRDRKILSDALYGFFRIGNALPAYPWQQRMAIGMFLCDSAWKDFYQELMPELKEFEGMTLSSRIGVLHETFEFSLEESFPLWQMVSERINLHAFLTSHFIQPDLFLRSKKGKEMQTENFLRANEISFDREGTCFRLANQSKLPEPEEYLFEVQDRSSQQVIQFLHPKPNEYWWDCCAASGGKSLLLREQEADCYLMCSDNRETILQNLEERFRKAGIQKYKRRLIDLTAEIHSFEQDTFDGIILDAPCTGSGTWSRTPERILEVDRQKVEYFADLQLRIASNAVQFLKPGKDFIYITCSVFAAENEQVVESLSSEFSLDIIEAKYLQGYEHKADTMYVAVLRLRVV